MNTGDSTDRRASEAESAPPNDQHSVGGVAGVGVRRAVTDEMVERAVAAFWAQDKYEHTQEETVAAMRDALVAALEDR